MYPILRTLICLCGLAFCSLAADLKIGLLSPAQDPLAESLRRGATMAVEHENQKSGARTELILRGRPGQWGTEGDEAVALALDGEAAAMIAPPSGSASHQVMQVSGRTRIPAVSLCSDSSVTSSGIPWVIRVVPCTDAEAECIFSGVTNAKTLKWSALVPDGRAGREAAKDLSFAASRAGCALREPVRLPDDTQAWPQTLRTLLAEKSDALLLWLPPATSGAITKSLRQNGFAGTLAGPAWLRSPLFLTNATQSAEGFLIPSINSESGKNPRAELFTTDYTRQFGTAPDFAAYMAYDATLLLAQLAKASSDKPLFNLFPLRQEFQGASGLLRFDKDGNRQLTLQLLVCRKGEFATSEALSKACPAPTSGTISPPR